MTTATGKPGQFDVLVDGAVVARRSKNPFKVLVGGGWPAAAAVVAAIRERAAT